MSASWLAQLLGLVAATAGVCAWGYWLMVHLDQRKDQPAHVPCHFCRLYPAQPESLWCGSVCADAEIGVLGRSLR